MGTLLVRHGVTSATRVETRLSSLVSDLLISGNQDEPGSNSVQFLNPVDGATAPKVYFVLIHLTLQNWYGGLRKNNL
jgi:hypothetical protein